MVFRKALACISAVIAVMCGVAFAPVASAHDVVISSEPADGATVTEFPRKISLEFSGIPQESFNTIAVSNATTSEILFRTEPSLAQQFVSVDVPEDIQPGPGDYIVGFQITSSDGHSTRGKITFSVAGDTELSSSLTGTSPATSSESLTTTTSQTEPTSTPTSQETNITPWYLGGAVLVLVVVLAAVALLKRK